MERILITGGNGFLGQELSKVLANEGEVFLASRNNKNNRIASLKTSKSCIPLDISNIESVRDVFRYIKPTIIFMVLPKFVDLSEEFPFETIDVNIWVVKILQVSMENNVKLLLEQLIKQHFRMLCFGKALMEVIL